jgi:hypothetical protein
MIVGGVAAVQIMIEQRPKFAFIVAGLTLLFSLPGIVLTYFSYIWSQGGSALNFNTVTTIQSVGVISSNSTPLNALSLLGYWWSTITYISPLDTSGASIGSSSTLGNPPYGVFPSAWVLAFIAMPFVTYAALLFCGRLNSALISLSAIALIFTGAAMGTRFPLAPVVSLEVAMTRLPLVGFIWAVTYRVPIYSLTGAVAVYIPLCIFSINSIVDRYRKWIKKQGFRLKCKLGTRTLVFQYSNSGKRVHSHLAGRFLPFVLIVILLLPSWQFVTGDFYPAGYSPESSGNGIPDAGALSPETLPTGDEHVFSWLQQQDKAMGNIYWPGPAGLSYPWTDGKSSSAIASNSPLPESTPEGLTYALESNLTSDVAPLLSKFGIRYIVVDQMPPLAIQAAFGLNNTSLVVQFLSHCPGMELVLAYPPQVWVFQVSRSLGTVSIAGLPVSLSEGSWALPFSTSVLAQLNLSTTFVSPNSVFQGIQNTIGITVGNVSGRLDGKSVSILTPNNLSAQEIGDSVTGFTGTPNQTVNELVTPGNSQDLMPPYQNWSVTTWSQGGFANVTVDKGNSIGIRSPLDGDPYTYSLNYLSPLVDGEEGIPVSVGTLVSASASLNYRTSADFKGSVQLLLLASNGALANIAQLSSQPLNNSFAWKPETLSGELPSQSAYFTLRVQGTFSGELYISDIRISWVQAHAEPYVFSGNWVEVSNQSMAFSNNASSVDSDIQLDLSGYAIVTFVSPFTSESAYIHNLNFSWVRFPVPNGTYDFSLLVSGTIRLAGIVGFPQSLLSTPDPHINVSLGNAPFEYHVRVDSQRNALLVLSLPYSAFWELDVGGNLSRGLIGAFGTTQFLVPGGVIIGEILLGGSMERSTLLDGFGGYCISIVAFLIASWLRPSLFRRCIHVKA